MHSRKERRKQERLYADPKVDTNVGMQCTISQRL